MTPGQALTVTPDTDIWLGSGHPAGRAVVTLELHDLATDSYVGAVFSDPGSLARLRQLAVDVLMLTSPLAGRAARDVLAATGHRPPNPRRVLLEVGVDD